MVKIKEETYATEQGVGKATGRAKRSLSWLVTWSELVIVVVRRLSWGPVITC